MSYSWERHLARKAIEPQFKRISGRRKFYNKGRCNECNGELPSRRRNWCSETCVDAYMIRNNPKYARERVYRRDNGICARCGCDCNQMQAILDRLRPKGEYGKRTHSSEYKRAVSAKQEQSEYLYYQRRDKTWLSVPYVSNELAELKTLIESCEKKIADWEAFALYKKFIGSGKWYADHILAVMNGGGGCGLEGYQTLCHPCHAAKTSEDHAERKKRLGK